MLFLESTSELKDWQQRCSSNVTLVPTMGALHAGHQALIEHARMTSKENKVAVSIFVNPLQFGPNEDFEKYPRTLEADITLCKAAGCDLVFSPPAQDFYSASHSIIVQEKELSKGLCGASRPGHFDGVCTVVLKLLNLFQAKVAIFGKKDFQQLAIIRKMIKDLNLSTEILGHEIVREADGLALSSRNRYLSTLERKQAAGIYACLKQARHEFLAGNSNTSILLEHFQRELKKLIPQANIDYVSIVHQHSLKAQSQADKDSVMLAAVKLGQTRLIDNIEFSA